MFTCVCGGLGVIRNADVVCQDCGLVLMTTKISASATSVPYPDPGELWTKIRDRIEAVHEKELRLNAEESARDAAYLKNLGIRPLDE